MNLYKINIAHTQYELNIIGYSAVGKLGYSQFKQYQFDSELNIQEFYEAKVRLIGARIYQAA